MYTVFCSAKAARHIFVDFYDDMSGCLTHRTKMGSTWPEVEVSMLVHWSNLEHCHIIRTIQLTVITRELGITDRAVECTATCDHMTFDSGHMPGIPCKMLAGVFALKYGKRF